MAEHCAQHEVATRPLRLLTRTHEMTGRRALILLALVAAGANGCTMPQSVMSLSDVEASSGDGRIILIPVTGATAPQSLVSNAGFPQEFIDAVDHVHNVLGPGMR